jgi:hypothetical protein
LTKKRKNPIQKGTFPKRKRSNPLSSSTPASDLIDIHYETLGLRKLWNRDRIERLCGYLRLSQAELASMVAVGHIRFDGYIQRNFFPGPLALLLTMLETRYLKGLAADIITNLFDFHGSSRCTKED